SLTSAVPSECYAIDYSHSQDCENGCHTTNDLVDDFQEGNYTTQDSLVNCTRTLFDGEHTCSDALATAPRFVGCCYALDCEDSYADEAVNSCWGCPEDYEQIDNCCYANPHECQSNDDCGLEGWSCVNGRCSKTPILIDVAGNGFAMTNAANGVLFDFDGSGSPQR